MAGESQGSGSGHGVRREGTAGLDTDVVFKLSWIKFFPLL